MLSSGVVVSFLPEEHRLTRAAGAKGAASVANFL